MKRYALLLAYEGTRYGGWQKQPNRESVAGTVEAALGRLTGQPVHLVGAGRTDAGVHAWGQVAHWEGPAPLPSSFLRRLNALLPGDIQARAVYEAAPTFHARHSALSRTYRYYIHFEPNPFWRAYSWWIPTKIDVDTLQKAARLLIGTHDFSAFFKKGSPSEEHPICIVSEALWWEVAPGYWCFAITANRFLRAMVRALVGAQVRLAQGKLAWEKFMAALQAGDRGWGMHLAPPQGLFLWRVTYPENCLSLLESYEFLAAAHPLGTTHRSAPEPPSDTTGAPLGGS